MQRLEELWRDPEGQGGRGGRLGQGGIQPDMSGGHVGLGTAFNEVKMGLRLTGWQNRIRAKQELPKRRENCVEFSDANFSKCQKSTA